MARCGTGWGGGRRRAGRAGEVSESGREAGGNGGSAVLVVEPRADASAFGVVGAFAWFAARGAREGFRESNEASKGEGQGRAREATGRSGLSPESESERASSSSSSSSPPPGRAFVPSAARDLRGSGRGRELSGRGGEGGTQGTSCFHRAVAAAAAAAAAVALQARCAFPRRARARFRERENMILGQLAERWPRATRKRGLARYREIQQGTRRSAAARAVREN